MIRLTRDFVRRYLTALLHIDDTPERTAAAFAIGVFLGFSPLVGFHTVIAIVVAFLLNFNRVAVLLGVYSNLPWIVAPYYAFVTMFVGAPLTGHHIPPGFRRQVADVFEHSVFHEEFWKQLVIIFRPLVVPYTVGSLIGAFILGVIAYPLAFAFVTSQRRFSHLIHSRDKR
jgi:uncharacterized protein